MQVRLQQLIGLSLGMLLVGCSGESKSPQAQAPAPQASNPTLISAQPLKSQAFSNPVISPMTTVDVPAVPGLLKSTNAQARLPGITTGRSDPFASLTPSTLTLPISKTTTTARTQAAPGQRPRTVTLAPLPLPGAPITIPSLPPAPPGGTALPPIALPSLPSSSPTALPVSRTALADAVEVTGVMQAQGKWQVIVKEPNAETSRYVSAGDYLANGQVLVKKVIAGGKADPIVILQQNGVEIPKSIGGSSGTIARR